MSGAHVIELGNRCFHAANIDSSGEVLGVYDYSAAKTCNVSLNQHVNLTLCLGIAAYYGRIMRDSCSWEHVKESGMHFHFVIAPLHGL